jgi:hypothetical protein
MFPHHDGRYFQQTAVRKDGRFVFGAASKNRKAAVADPRRPFPVLVHVIAASEPIATRYPS